MACHLCYRIELDMINCPKCGFQQPPDQFCASCGVNMAKYRPAKKPLLVRLRESRIAQAVALTLVIAVGLLYLKSKIFDREDEMTFSTLEQEEKSAPNINLPKREMPRDTAAARGYMPPAPNNPPIGSMAQKSLSPPPTEKPMPVPEVFNAQVIFLEVPKATFEKELAPFVRFQGANQVRGGSLNKLSETLLKESHELGRQAKSMQKKEVWDISRRARAIPNDTQEYGFSLQVENSDNAENQRTIQFDYLSHLPLYAERKIASIETSEMNDSVKVPATGGFFIVGGGFPRRTGNEEYPLSGGVFDILNSPRFKESESEFVILVVPKP